MPESKGQLRYGREYNRPPITNESRVTRPRGRGRPPRVTRSEPLANAPIYTQATRFATPGPTPWSNPLNYTPRASLPTPHNINTLPISVGINSRASMTFPGSYQNTGHIVSSTGSGHNRSNPFVFGNNQTSTTLGT